MQAQQRRKEKSSRVRRRELIAEARGAFADAPDCLDTEALENDTNDGKLLASLLEEIDLGQYFTLFLEQQCVTIRDAKSLSHDDLVEFGVDSFGHREKLIDVFQNYGRIGSMLARPERNTMSVQSLYSISDEFDTELKNLDIAEFGDRFASNGCDTVEALHSLKLSRLGRMGFADDEQEIIKNALARGLAEGAQESHAEDSEVNEKRDRKKQLYAKHASSSSSSSSLQIPKGLARHGSSVLKSAMKPDNSSDSSRPRSLRFADQVDWICRVCSVVNEHTAARCHRCGSTPETGRIEHVRTLEACEPWRCGVCRNINNASLAFCQVCNLKRIENFESHLDDLEFRSGDRVKVSAHAQDQDQYKDFCREYGTVVEVDVEKPFVSVRWDNEKFMKMPNEDVRKPESLAIRINTMIQKILPAALTSPGSR